LLPDDCPTQLSDLVVDCCQQMSHDRPNFETIIHRLHDILVALHYHFVFICLFVAFLSLFEKKTDIQYLLPYFSIVNEPVYEFEELLEEVKVISPLI
jgi:hypothetical protein